jgi:cobalt-zinc-cadmium efflux system membrane fusion protein
MRTYCYAWLGGLWLGTSLGCRPSPAADAAQATPPEAAQKSSLTANRHFDPKWHEFVKMQTVQHHDAPLYLKTTGSICFDDDHTQHVAAPVDGRVAAIKVRLGQRVSPGTVLVELSSAKVAELQSDAKKERQDLQLAQNAWRRALQLRKDGAVSDKDLALAEADLHKSRAEVERAEAQLTALGIASTDPVVRAALYARIAATVVDRSVSVGQEVRSDAGTPLMTLTNLDRVWVMADVYEQDLGLVQPNAKVTVQVPAYPGQSFAGTVSYIGDVLDPQSRTVKVRCEIDNPTHALKPHMFASISIAYQGGRDDIFIPTRALVRDGTKTEVLTVAKNGSIDVRGVQVGSELEGKQRILHGLQTGDVIISDGAVFLRNALGD